MVSNIYRCESVPDGLRILEVRGLDGDIVIQEEIGGQPITELASYLFSAQENLTGEIPRNPWYADQEGNILTEEEGMELPVLKGLKVNRIHLPKTIRRVGSYCMYNCEQLKALEFYSTTLDWGNGAFFGCIGLEELMVHVEESARSCLKEVLMELKQTLRVSYRGKERAELIFGRYYEEAIENTPARILSTDVHGCGLKYRNAFLRTQFQFGEYDSLFRWIQHTELEDTAIELAEKRLRYPVQLGSNYQKMYQNYIHENRLQAALLAIKEEDMEILRWLTEQEIYTPEELKEMIDCSNQENHLSVTSFLMEKQRGNVGQRRKRFSL